MSAPIRRAECTRCGDSGVIGHEIEVSCGCEVVRATTELEDLKERYAVLLQQHKRERLMRLRAEKQAEWAVGCAGHSTDAERERVHGLVMERAAKLQAAQNLEGAGVLFALARDIRDGLRAEGRG